MWTKGFSGTPYGHLDTTRALCRPVAHFSGTSLLGVLHSPCTPLSESPLGGLCSICTLLPSNCLPGRIPLGSHDAIEVLFLHVPLFSFPVTFLHWGKEVDHLSSGVGACCGLFLSLSCEATARVDSDTWLTGPQCPTARHSGSCVHGGFNNKYQDWGFIMSNNELLVKSRLPMNCYSNSYLYNNYCNS